MQSPIQVSTVKNSFPTKVGWWSSFLPDIFLPLFCFSQDCKVCKTRFSTYEELRVHRQIHDKKTVEVVVGNSTSSGADVMAVHSRVGAMADISNRGGVKCLLCNTFKLRKDHLKNHYVRHHGSDCTNSHRFLQRQASIICLSFADMIPSRRWRKRGQKKMERRRLLPLWPKTI